MNRPVNLLKLHFSGRAVFDVLNQCVEPALSDPFVRVKPGASITLWGKLVKCPVTPSNGEFNDQPAWDSGSRWVTSSDSGELYFWLDWRPNMGAGEEQVSQSHLCLFFFYQKP